MSASLTQGKVSRGQGEVGEKGSQPSIGGSALEGEVEMVLRLSGRQAQACTSKQMRATGRLLA